MKLYRSENSLILNRFKLKCTWFLSTCLLKDIFSNLIESTPSFLGFTEHFSFSDHLLV